MHQVSHLIVSRRSVLRGFGATAAALAGHGMGVSHAATGADLGALYEAAKKEGAITFYCSVNPVLTQRVVQAFNARYPGIRVDVIRLATGPLAKRYASEAEAGNVLADLLQLGDPFLMQEAFEKKWLASIEDLPAHAAFPAAFKGPGYAIVAINTHTISFNTTLVKPSEVAKWTDVLNPKWKGQIMSADFRNSPPLIDWAYLMMSTFGKEFLVDLAKQDIRWVSSTVPGTQQLAAGESAILMPNMRSVTFSVIDKGGPVDETTPLPSTGFEFQLGVSTKAAHPNAARLLANFIMSREGAEAQNKGISASPLPGIPGVVALPKDYRHANLRESIKHTGEILSLMKLS